MAFDGLDRFEAYSSRGVLPHRKVSKRAGLFSGGMLFSKTLFLIFLTVYTVKSSADSIKIDVSQDGLSHLSRMHCKINANWYSVIVCPVFHTMNSFIDGFQYGVVRIPSLGLVNLPELSPTMLFKSTRLYFEGGAQTPPHNQSTDRSEFCRLDWKSVVNRFKSVDGYYSSAVPDFSAGIDVYPFHFNEFYSDVTPSEELQHYSHRNLWFASAKKSISVVGIPSSQTLFLKKNIKCPGAVRIRMLCLYDNEKAKALKKQPEPSYSVLSEEELSGEPALW